tara:strand:+ start:6225 stop:7088 length:864 start_codon:yes stop_codon:yes gene_type:complete
LVKVDLIKLIRPTQWVKNSFVLAPLLFTHSFTNANDLLNSAYAVLIFCIASSVTYIFNDYKDIEADRNHPTKSKSRPLASKTVSKNQGFLLGLFLFLILVILLAFAMSLGLILVIMGYLLLNVCYSILLKNYPFIDVICVSAGFVLRVYAGAIAISVPVSPWMFVTTLSVALFISISKRKHELYLIDNPLGSTRAVLRNYSLGLTRRLVIVTGTLTLIFYSLFVITSKENLIITVPLVAYGLFRYWYICEHYGKGESPAEAIFTDKQLLLCATIWTILSGWLVWNSG